MVVLIFQVARYVCYTVVLLSSGPLCVRLCCSHMVVLIFQVARFVCYCTVWSCSFFKWPVLCATVLFPHGRAHLSSGLLCVLLCCSPMVVLIFQVARYVCHCAVPTWSCSSFKWPIMCAIVLFSYGRAHLSSGPLCVLLCCSHMVVLIFQVARYVCHCAVPTWSCSSFKWPIMCATVLFPHGRAHLSSCPLCVPLCRSHMVVLIFQVARYVCHCAVPTWSCSSKWPVMCATVLFPHGRAHLSSCPLCVLRRCSHMVVLIFQVARYVCYCAVPIWSYSSFKWLIMCAIVLFPYGRAHLSSGPLCVLLCCSHMVVLIFQVTERHTYAREGTLLELHAKLWCDVK